MCHDQIVVSHILKQHVLHIHHYASLGKHSCRCKQYQSIWKNKHWPALVVPRCWIVSSFQTGAQICIQVCQHVQQKEILSASAPLKSVVAGVLAYLARTSHSCKFFAHHWRKVRENDKIRCFKSILTSRVPQEFVKKKMFSSGPPKEQILYINKCLTARFLGCQLYTDYTEFVYNDLTPADKRTNRKI